MATLPATQTGRSVRELGALAVAVLEAMRAYGQAGNQYVFPGAPTLIGTLRCAALQAASTR